MTKIPSDNELEFQLSSNTTGDKPLPTNLIRKIISILRRQQLSPINQTDPNPNKQLFGGRLPPFIERIIQRIQNYFSVYNPPEYFESNRPPTAQNEGITIICSNSANDSLSCNEMNEQERPNEQDAEICDSSATDSSDGCASGHGSAECSETNAQNVAAQDEYNVVVTHTVVQDSLLNVYSPTDTTHMVSNVVVILEPSAAEYSPPVESTTRNKFYVYVNPSAGGKDGLKNSQNDDSTEKMEKFHPYLNTTYTVIIRGDKLEEYNNNVDNADNDSLNPDIAVYVKNSTNNATLKICKLTSSQKTANSNCSQKAAKTNTYSSQSQSPSEQIVLASRSVGNATGEQTKNDNKVPNINLMLVPPDEHRLKNKSCPTSSKNKVTSTPNLEYYILKPDNGSNKITKEKEKQAYYLQKTHIDAAISQTYLPPPPPLPQQQQQQYDNNDATTAIETTTDDLQNQPYKSPLSFNLFKKNTKK